jgi:hypothetical protein
MLVLALVSCSNQSQGNLPSGSVSVREWPKGQVGKVAFTAQTTVSASDIDANGSFSYALGIPQDSQLVAFPPVPAGCAGSSVVTPSGVRFVGVSPRITLGSATEVSASLELLNQYPSGNKSAVLVYVEKDVALATDYTCPAVGPKPATRYLSNTRYKQGWNYQVVAVSTGSLTLQETSVSQTLPPDLHWYYSPLFGPVTLP